MDIKENVPLAPLTTMKVGGEARYFAVAHSEEELVELARTANKNGWAVTILGGGSNMIVREEGVDGLVIKNEIRGVTALDAAEEGKVRVMVGAGEEWDAFVAHTVSQGWWGLENLSAIPGSVGATPIQNVGAYGVEVASVIESVRAYSLATNALVEMSNAECRFGYRDSIFKSPEGKGLAVVSVTFQLSTVPNPVLHYKDLAARFGDGPTPSQADIRAAVIDIRSKKFPDWNELGTAGSFFKNPVIGRDHYEKLQRSYPELPGFPEPDGRMKVPLGWILDKVCGLKGSREGNVGTYGQQSLVLVNYGGATTTDVLSFAEKIMSQVKEKTDIDIEREPVLI